MMEKDHVDDFLSSWSSVARSECGGDGEVQWHDAISRLLLLRPASILRPIEASKGWDM